MWTRVVDEVICIIQNAGGKKTNLFMSLSEPHMYASRISFMDFIMKSIHSLIKMQFFFVKFNFGELWLEFASLTSSESSRQCWPLKEPRAKKLLQLFMMQHSL